MTNITKLSTKTKTVLALTAGLLLACSGVVAPGAVHANPGDACPTVDPITGGTLQVVGARKLYSNGERRFHRVPQGAAISVVPTAGMTETDLERAAHCHAGKADSTSPLGVAGVKVRVERSGRLYVMHITADSHTNALEVQRRAAAIAQR